MAKAEIFHVVNNVTLDFESEGHKYLMKLLVEDGLIILQDENKNKKYLFLGEKHEGYTGEILEPTLEIPEKAKRKRSRKKK